jgi:hypothetical protein
MRERKDGSVVQECVGLCLGLTVQVGIVLEELADHFLP